MAKISLSKISSDELDRMLGSDTTEAVSKDTQMPENAVSKDTENDSDTDEVENRNVSAIDISEGTDRSVTTKTESQRVNQWKKENRDTLRIDLPKGMKAEIQAEARIRGCSVTTLIQKAIAMYCSATTAEERSATTEK